MGDLHQLKPLNQNFFPIIQRKEIIMGLQSLDSCGNGCGLVAAFVGMIGFGSFGAPLKCKAIDMCSPDPFVLQTYKSLMCFVTSCITVLVSFSWGIFFFDEQVNSISSTAFGVMMLILGFIGMAYFSSGSNSGSSDVIGSEQTLELSVDLNEPLLNSDSEDVENCDQHSNNTTTSNENEQTQATNT